MSLASPKTGSHHPSIYRMTFRYKTKCKGKIFDLDK